MLSLRIETLSSEVEVVEHKQICSKCDGSGYLASYRHVSGGTCFRCQGSGYKTCTVKRDYVLSSIQTKARILEPEQTFEDLLASWQAEKEREQKAVESASKSGEFNIFDYLEELA
jgi:hypothetical protein